uniref:Uncharacterized protein n=1 Tax=Populus alba TaxID=43335 RepID=A0A4U5QJ43_POPAL|nr:hypothetical protein D5086_0000095610 [Populus alba]
MEAEKRKSFEDLFEEEEDVGLACPPFDEEDFMAAEASYSDLSEEVFFSRIDNDHKSSESHESLDLTITGQNLLVHKLSSSIMNMAFFVNSNHDDLTTHIKFYNFKKSTIALILPTKSFLV